MKMRTWWIALALTTCLAGCSDDTDDLALKQTEQSGAQVLKAIKSFREETGSYPKSLDRLVPSFLSEIPQPAWGLQRWTYNTTEDWFTLSVHEAARSGAGSARWFVFQSWCPEHGCSWCPEHGWEFID